MGRANPFAVFDLVGALVIVVDAEGRVIGWNRRCRELTGRSFDEVAGARLWELFPEGFDREALQRSLAELRGSRAAVHYESFWRGVDGERRLIAWSAVAMAGAEDLADQFVTTGIDITAHQRVEDALRVAQAEAEGIISISADAIVSIDEEQRITIFNQGAEEAFGYTKEEALGQPLDILIPERFRDSHRLQVDQFAAGPIVARHMGERRAVPALRKGGEEFLVEAAISNLQVGRRKIMTAVLRDITDRERLERDQRFLIEAGRVLASSLDYEKTLTEVAQLAVRSLADYCIVDIIEDGRARRLRVAVADPAKSELGERLRSHTTTGGYPPFARRALETGEGTLEREVTPALLEAISDDAAHFAFLCRLELRSYISVPLVARERLLGAIVFLSSGRRYEEEDFRVANDLTVRAARAIDNARLHGEAQRAIRARDAILGIVAHDLRNPLNAIVLSTRLLGGRLGQKGAPEGTRETVEAILRAADRANRLIADLLDVTRIEGGTLAIDLRTVSVGELIRDVAELSRPLCARFTLAVELADGLPDVYADRDRLMQVFSNLIGNAIKFTPEGGTITLGATAAEAAVVFHVADTGAGISEEHQRHLFDRFWQADRRDRRGAGLGLTIAKGIVEGHRGRMWVKSAPGEGSTFYFTIPTIG